jgi:hypothetical protein
VQPLSDLGQADTFAIADAPHVESISRARLVRDGAAGLLLLSAIGAISVPRADASARLVKPTPGDVQLFDLSVRAERPNPACGRADVWVGRSHSRLSGTRCMNALIDR